jgi:hypothetical protein
MKNKSTLSSRIFMARGAAAALTFTATKKIMATIPPPIPPLPDHRSKSAEDIIQRMQARTGPLDSE